MIRAPFLDSVTPQLFLFLYSCLYTVWHHQLKSHLLWATPVLNERKTADMVLSPALSLFPSFLLCPLFFWGSNTVDHRSTLYLSSSLPSAPCLSSVIWCTVVYWLGFVVQRNNRSSVWIEEADEWCSLSRTKSPPLFFIDVLMRLSWLPSKFVLYTVVGLQADRCTWTLKAEKGFYAFFIVSIPLTLMTSLVALLLLFSLSLSLSLSLSPSLYYSNSATCNSESV